MKLYYVETGMGCTVVKAKSAAQARAMVLKMVGTYNGVDLVREATDFDVAWYKQFSGCEDNNILTEEMI